MAQAGVLGNDTDADMRNGRQRRRSSAGRPTARCRSLDGSFVYTPNANFFGVDSFTYRANDGSANSNVATVTITVFAVNDAPVNTVPGAQTTNEDTAKVFSSGNGNQISIADIDAGGANNQVTLSVTNGSMTLSGVAGLSFTAGDGTADATMTFRGTAAAINTALNGLSYNPTSRLQRRRDADAGHQGLGRC